jgi:hypothetical protein
MGGGGYKTKIFTLSRNKKVVQLLKLRNNSDKNLHIQKMR